MQIAQPDRIAHIIVMCVSGNSQGLRFHPDHTTMVLLLTAQGDAVMMLRKTQQPSQLHSIMLVAPDLVSQQNIEVTKLVHAKCWSLWLGIQIVCYGEW